MPRLNHLFSFATLLAISASAALAQAPADNSSDNQNTPAPIERAAPGYGPNAVQPPSGAQYGGQYNGPRNNMRHPAQAAIKESSPAPGIILRVSPNGVAERVSTNKDAIEIRVTRGKANVSVRGAKQDSQILVDLPGGQADLYKDGLYTFNAETNTVSVLIGEAKAFPGANPSAKGIKIKEDHQLAFVGSNIHSVDVGPYQARMDLLPQSGTHGDGFRGGYPIADYGYGPYGDGFVAGYPYYGWGYPYAYDYPFGWGYPVGIGFGYGFYGGYGFRGGYGGFHGRR